MYDADSNGSIEVLVSLTCIAGVEPPFRVAEPELVAALNSEGAEIERAVQDLLEAGYLERDADGDHGYIQVSHSGLAVLADRYQRLSTVFQTPPPLVGRVADGNEKAQEFLTLEGYERQFRERLGYTPYPGTLNLRLLGRQSRSVLGDVAAVRIREWQRNDDDYGGASCYPAVTAAPASGNAYEGGHLIVPDRTGHDDDVIEILAPDELRSALEVGTDDIVTVRIRSSGGTPS